MISTYRRHTNLVFGVLLGLILLVSSILTWANYQYAVQNPGGNDFLVHWMGTRNLLLNNISPYSDQTALDIQTMAYGRAARPDEHQLRVAYPLYSIVLFAPFAFIEDFTLARAVWMTLLEICLVLISFILINICEWKLNLFSLTTFLIFSLFWYHGLRPLINGNAVIVITLLICLVILFINNGNDEIAGVMLAFSTIKPQIALVFFLFIMVWSWRQKRWNIMLWTFSTLALLILTTTLMIPDWLWQNFLEVLRYPAYNPPGNLAAALLALLPGLGERLPWIVAGFLGIVLLIEWIVVRKQKDPKPFIWTASITLVISQWIGIQTDPGNFILLMPALVLVLSILETRWRWGKAISFLILLSLFVGLWVLFIQTGTPGAQFQQSPVMFLPLPGILLILLYWVRWWVFRPPTVWFDEIESFYHLKK